MDKMRRKYQRQLNKAIRKVNLEICEDPLWKGRFVIRQKTAEFERFEDGSGGILIVILRMVDKKTKYYRDIRMEYAPYLEMFFRWHLFLNINDFIIKDCGVWQQDPRPTLKNAIDFTKVNIGQNVMDAPYNFYLKYQG